MLRAVLGADEAGIAGAEGHAHDGVVAGGLSLSEGGRDRKSFEAHEQMAQHRLGTSAPKSLVHTHGGVRLWPRLAIDHVRHEGGPCVGDLRRGEALVPARGRPRHVNDHGLRRADAALGCSQAPVGTCRGVKESGLVVKHHAEARQVTRQDEAEEPLVAATTTDWLAAELVADWCSIDRRTHKLGQISSKADDPSGVKVSMLLIVTDRLSGGHLPEAPVRRRLVGEVGFRGEANSCLRRQEARQRNVAWLSDKRVVRIDHHDDRLRALPIEVALKEQRLRGERCALILDVQGAHCVAMRGGCASEWERGREWNLVRKGDDMQMITAAVALSQRAAYQRRLLLRIVVGC
jgi:hypothetical protein